MLEPQKLIALRLFIERLAGYHDSGMAIYLEYITARILLRELALSALDDAGSDQGRNGSYEDILRDIRVDLYGDTRPDMTNEIAEVALNNVLIKGTAH